MSDGIVMGFCAVAIAAFAVLLTAVVVHNEDERNAFKAKCAASNGRVMETRYTDLCFDGNTLLFVKNW